MVEEKTTSGKLHGVVGVSGLAHTTDGLTVLTDRTFRLELPRHFTPDIIQRMQKDFEGVAAILREHPQEATDILEAVVQNNVGDARKTASRIGLTEEAFADQGGGLIWWVVAAVVVVVIIVAEGEAE